MSFVRSFRFLFLGMLATLFTSSITTASAAPCTADEVSQFQVIAQGINTEVTECAEIEDPGKENPCACPLVKVEDISKSARDKMPDCEIPSIPGTDEIAGTSAKEFVDMVVTAWEEECGSTIIPPVPTVPALPPVLTSPVTPPPFFPSAVSTVMPSSTTTSTTTSSTGVPRCFMSAGWLTVSMVGIVTTVLAGNIAL